MPIKLLIISSVLLCLFSCGNSQDFNNQKYTRLKKIKVSEETNENNNNIDSYSSLNKDVKIDTISVSPFVEYESLSHDEKNSVIPSDDGMDEQIPDLSPCDEVVESTEENEPESYYGFDNYKYFQNKNNAGVNDRTYGPALLAILILLIGTSLTVWFLHLTIYDFTHSAPGVSHTGGGVWKLKTTLYSLTALILGSLTVFFSSTLFKSNRKKNANKERKKMNEKTKKIALIIILVILLPIFAFIGFLGIYLLAWDAFLLGGLILAAMIICMIFSVTFLIRLFKSGKLRKI